MRVEGWVRTVGECMMPDILLLVCWWARVLSGRCRALEAEIAHGTLVVTLEIGRGNASRNITEVTCWARDTAILNLVELVSAR